MTGYGRGECGREGMTVTVELSSVNGRFFDLRSKLPRVLNEYENDLKKMVQEHVDRGRLQLTVSFDRTGLKAQEISVDHDLAGRYAALAKELSERCGIPDTLDTATVLNLPETVSWNESAIDVEELWSLTRDAALAAIESHREMREKEGEAMGADLAARLDAIAGHVEEIKKRAPEAVEANTDRLRAKICKLLEKTTIDEARFTQEIAQYADRVDITEECVRLDSHREQFSAELESEKASGRKLTFLLQEMNREANTIASKVMNAGISQIVVGIKEEMEKMREQAENME